MYENSSLKEEILGSQYFKIEWSFTEEALLLKSSQEQDFFFFQIIGDAQLFQRDWQFPIYLFREWIRWRQYSCKIRNSKHGK